MALLEMIAIAALAGGGAPQSPIAAGPFGSSAEILKAAHACGIDYLRAETYAVPKMGEVRFYLMDEPAPAALRCLTHWETSNGSRLHLKPRWWKDDFTKDAP